jgi:hypothetical protein
MLIICDAFGSAGALAGLPPRFMGMKNPFDPSPNKFDLS